MSFSQKNEEATIIEYFRSNNPTCLSIGENNGEHLSNVRQLILNGSSATLAEPAPKAFIELCELYGDRTDVDCLNFAVSNFVGKTKFYDSGTHLNKGDTSLLSTIVKEDYNKWKKSTDFKEIEVDVIDVKSLLKLAQHTKFEFISIDAEGCDLIILRQINLTELSCECICIEHNTKPEILKEIKEYCATFGLVNELLCNSENVILSI